MAVLIEATSVVIRADSLLKSFNGDWEGFKAIVPNQTLCADNEIVRVGFMTPDDVESFIKKVEKSGLTFLSDDQSVDIAVVDQMRGPCWRLCKSALKWRSNFVGQRCNLMAEIV